MGKQVKMGDKSSKKVRILHIVQSAGGVDRYLRSLLKYLDSDDYENYLLASDDFDLEKYVGICDKTIQIKMFRNISLKDIPSLVKIRAEIIKTDPDIIYAHSSKAGALARLANIGIYKTCIYNPHGWSFNMRCNPYKRKIYVLIERLLAPLATKIVCISNMEKDSAKSNKVCQESQLEVIKNGIDLKHIPDKNCNEIMRRKLGFEKEEIIIGMVGRLSYQKGPDVFINSCKLVANEIPNCRFLIVGDGEDRQSIIQLAKKNGIADQLIITGWVENPLDYISTFDIACLFSRWEGFGLVLPEYMAMQKPIVATNVDAIPEIVQNKKNGLLVPVDNPIASAEAIIKLLKNERWRSVIVETARKEVLKEYDINRVAHEHQLLFEKVIKMP